MPVAEEIHYYSIILGGKGMKKILALLLVVVMVFAIWLRMNLKESPVF